MEFMKKWINRKDFDPKLVMQMAEENNITPLSAGILIKREIDNVPEFINPDSGSMNDPVLLKDAVRGCELIAQGILDNKKFCIVNDYDVDGATSGVIMKEVVEACGGEAVIISPDRNIDGYGISYRIIDLAEEQGCNFIVTTDNGIAAVDQIKYAKEKGFIVVITDHHEVPYVMDGENRTYVLPCGDAVIDPKQSDCNYPFKNICGAVVVYKMAEILLSIFEIPMESKTVLLNRYLELAAIGTICDVMPLVDENRTIVSKGLKLLRLSSFVGLRQLMRELNINPDKISSYNIGFGIGPCLNAVGRMRGSVDLAVSLLLEKDHMKALEIAKELKDINEIRKEESRREEERAISMIDNYPDNNIFVLYIPDSNPAIMGIVAGRVKDQTGHPVICLTDSEDGILKGSGRSVQSYDMFSYLSRHRDLYEKFGGHELAAGLSIKKENLDAVREALNQDVTEFPEDSFCNISKVDIYIPMLKISQKDIEELSMFEPVGMGNPKPVFCDTGVLVLKLSRIGKDQNYVRFYLASNGKRYEAVFFGNAGKLDDYISEHYGKETLDNLYRGMTDGRFTMDFLYTPRINSWKGEESIEYTINDYM